MIRSSYWYARASAVRRGGEPSRVRRPPETNSPPRHHGDQLEVSRSWMQMRRSEIARHIDVSGPVHIEAQNSRRRSQSKEQASGRWPAKIGDRSSGVARGSPLAPSFHSGLPFHWSPCTKTIQERSPLPSLDVKTDIQANMSLLGQQRLGRACRPRRATEKSIARMAKSGKARHL